MEVKAKRGRGNLKGTPKPAKAGRKKGTPNKTTAEIREAYAMLIEKNLPKFDRWINTIAETDPERALKLILELSVYVIPKLASSDLKIEEVNNNVDLSKLSNDELDKLIELNEKIS